MSVTQAVGIFVGFVGLVSLAMVPGARGQDKFLAALVGIFMILLAVRMYF